MADLTSVTIVSDPAGKPETTPPNPAVVAGERPGTVKVDPAKLEEKKETPPEDLSKLSREDLEKNYKELRTKMSKDGAPKPEKAVEPVKDLAAPDAAKLVAAAGLDLGKLEAEYAEKGVISEESLKALEAKGVTRETVANYIKGQEAIASQLRTDFHAIAGGEAGLKATIEWAAANMTAEQLAPYEEALTKGDLATAKLLMKGIVAEYTKANGKEPKLVTAPSTPRGASEAQPFASNAEITTAMGDPRYKRGDAAYIKAVEARMAVTDYGKLR